MVGSWDDVSCGAETVMGEKVFCSLMNKIKKPSTWFCLWKGQATRVLRRGCAWRLHGPRLWMQIIEQEGECGLNCCLSGFVGAFHVQLQVAADLATVCG